MSRGNTFAVAALGATLLFAGTLLAATTSKSSNAGSTMKADDPKPPSNADASEPAASDSKAPSDKARISEEVTVEANRLSEELVYSVNRTPERTFDTPRAVQVITAEQIRRKAGFELSDIVMQESGFFMSPAGNGGGSVIVRGLASRQMLVMIDGVKINNSTWRTFSDLKEHFNLIDPSEIERIEIVRGLVSVLGSEALGGAVNIITKKGPDGVKRFGASLSTRYSSADQGKAAAFQIHGQGSRYRYIGGVSDVDTEDLENGNGIEQLHTGYRGRAGFAHYDFFPTSEKTISLGYRFFERASELLSYVNSPLVNGHADVDPMRMQMATLRYDDMTNRGWEDSLTATAYWNRQDDGRDYVLRSGSTHRYHYNSDKMIGLNVEAGKFLRSHHVIYGFDHTSEKIGSSQAAYIGGSTTLTHGRGDYLDGGKYNATAIYLNDHFSLTKWLTLTAGARYGRYVSSGKEVLPLIGAFDAGSTKSNLTSSLNVVFHATPTLNFVGNYVRGFRPPNMHDMTYGGLPTVSFAIPNVNVEAERMNSLEGGVKYDSGRFSGSAFYFNNDLSNLLVTGPSTFNGLSFVDFNGNGTRNPGEPSVQATRNIGQSTVKGYELDARFMPTANLTLWGNYARTIGENNDVRQSLSRIQPRLANIGTRVSANAGHRVWTEAIFTYGSASVGPTGVRFPGFHVYTLRGGANVTDRISLTLAIENVFDERYRFAPSQALVDQPGRQAVLATEFNF